MCAIFYLIRISPVISVGISTPIILSMVGAISASFPFSIFLKPVLSAKHGTKLVLCAVLGLPSGFMAKSAFPWSAIMIQAYSFLSPASTTFRVQVSTFSTAFYIAL
jgi:hypothetical protein